MRPRLCKYGLKCSKIDECDFSHDAVNRPCRFGVNCTKLKIGACLFNHDHIVATHDGIMKYAEHSGNWTVKGDSNGMQSWNGMLGTGSYPTRLNGSVQRMGGGCLCYSE